MVELTLAWGLVPGCIIFFGWCDRAARVGPRGRRPDFFGPRLDPKQMNALQWDDSPDVQYFGGYDRGTKISRAIVAFNIVFLAVFIAGAVLCGYYAWNGSSKASPKQRNMLAAGSVASCGGAVASAMCLAYIARQPDGFHFVDAPWYVPFVVMLGGGAAAAVCGDMYSKQYAKADKLNKVGQSLAGFSTGLGIVGVTLPWLGTSAVSWCI
jgi:hypothetical protein